MDSTFAFLSGVMAAALVQAAIELYRRKDILFKGSTELDVRFLLMNAPEIHAAMLQLETSVGSDYISQRDRESLAKIQEVHIASSRPELWAVLITALDFGTRNWRSPNDVYGTRAASDIFHRTLNENANLI